MNFKTDMSVKNILAITALILMSAVQLWLFIAFIALATPPANTLSHEVFPEWWHMLHPEHEALIYHGFILTCLVGLAVAVLFLKQRLENTSLWQALRRLLCLDALVTALMLAAGFKMVIYAPQAQLATAAVKLLAVLALSYKISWIWLMPQLHQGWSKLSTMMSRYSLSTQLNWLILGVIFLIFYIPHPTAVMARMFFGEQVHHYDSAVASPAWAFLSGAKLNMDVISQYGLGLPIAVGLWAQAMGGDFYTSSLIVLVMGAIIYFCLWYLVLRCWLKDAWLACAAVILGIATQMFHAGAYPVAFTYPSTTVWRFLFDAVFFLSLYAYANRGQSIFLILAGCVTGVSLFHMSTTGLCLLLTLAAYIIADAIVNLRQGKILRLGCYALSVVCVFVVAAALLGAFVGPKAFTGEFWRNMNEFNNYFLSGFGVEPMDGPLRQHQLFAGFLGFIIPLFLTAVLLIEGSTLLFANMTSQGLMALMMAVYGLLMFHYYVSRSVVANAFVVALPCVFLVFYVISRLKVMIARPWYQCLSWGAVLLSVYALVTSHQFIAYPNLLNASSSPMIDNKVFAPLPDGRSYFNHLYSQLPLDGRLPFNSLGETAEGIKTEKDFANDEQLARFYVQEFDFSEDAALIDRLTAAQERVAIVSSFETRFLLQAKRQPFFYYTPLIISRPLRMRTMAVTALYTTGHLERTLVQIQQARPPYIFIERIFSSDNIAKANYQDGSAFLTLMKFIHARYEPYATGCFLMALKLKGTQ